MKSDIGISIHQPCTQNWDKMQPAERGRFCAMCEKTVVDVTNWPKEEILNEHLKSVNGLCIRIPEAQLQNHRKQTSSRNIYKAFFISLLIFFSKLPIVRAFVQAPFANDGNPASQDKSTKIQINGIVYDSTQTENPVSYATIIIFNNDQIIATAFTDWEGKYSINITKDSTLGDSIVVECSHLSYSTLIKKVKVESEVQLDLYLQESTISLHTILITRERDIIMGGMRMGIPIIIKAEPTLNLDPYDTKTYYQNDLQRYNFR